MAFNFSPKVVTDGLELYLDAANTKSYPGSGTAWNDLSRNQKNSSILTNSPTFSGGNGGSIFFDGTDDYATLDFVAPTNVSMLFWINGNYSNYYLGVFERTTITGAGLNVPIPYNGWIQVGYIASGSTNHFVINGVRYLSNDNGRYSYDNASDRPIYSAADVLGGGPSAPNFAFSLQSSSGGAGSYVWSDKDNRLLGKAQTGGPTFNNRYFTGNISQTLIYNRPLTAEEVLQNYNATRGRYGL